MPHLRIFINAPSAEPLSKILPEMILAPVPTPTCKDDCQSLCSFTTSEAVCPTGIAIA